MLYTIKIMTVAHHGPAPAAATMATATVKNPMAICTEES
jgi:hypothetical protein